MSKILGETVKVHSWHPVSSQSPMAAGVIPLHHHLHPSGPVGRWTVTSGRNLGRMGVRW